MEKRLEDLLVEIKQFRDERNWKQFHNHKDMAISLVLEANELLEHFQWKTDEEISRIADEKKEGIEEELGDIFIYLLELSDNLGVDIIAAAENKLAKNRLKYPVDKSKGLNRKYTEL